MSKNTNVVPGRLTTGTSRIGDSATSSNSASAQTNAPNNLLSLLRQYLPGYETASKFGQNTYDYFNPPPKPQYSYNPLTENEWVHAEGDLDTLSVNHLMNDWGGDIPQINKIQMMPGEDYGVSRPIMNYDTNEQGWKLYEEEQARKNQPNYEDYGTGTSQGEWWE